MKVVTNDIELKIALQDFNRGKRKLGFIPTMGALHEGHLHLVKQSHEENDITVVSIFINPKQFNNQDDFDKYPVTLESDKELLERGHCDILLLPSQEVIYPKGFKPVKVDIDTLNKVFEGPMRPGHFDGVIQVVNRLFEIVTPDVSYFGLKDFQQCLVIKALRNELFPKMELKFVPTIRKAEGLALSSRNARLSQLGQEKANIIFKTLAMIKELKKHIEPYDALKYGKHILTQNGFEVEYFALANADTLIESKKWLRNGKNIVLAAVWLEGVRLIDNYIF
ncbi:MAG: pantoate--beta-alanine ligase [Bacteroidia bacterium]|nr:pantoate--beta-alanine ligase [Bacteroidia bacterium]